MKFSPHTTLPLPRRQELLSGAIRFDFRTSRRIDQGASFIIGNGDDPLRLTLPHGGRAMIHTIVVEGRENCSGSLELWLNGRRLFESPVRHLIGAMGNIAEGQRDFDTILKHAQETVRRLVTEMPENGSLEARLDSATKTKEAIQAFTLATNEASTSFSRAILRHTPGHLNIPIELMNGDEPLTINTPGVTSPITVTFYGVTARTVT